MRSSVRRVTATIVISALFGVVVAVVKGGDAGVRDSLGNMSAPWLLLPYFAGTMTRGWIRGAVVGIAACLASLVAFYAAEAFVLDLGGHWVLTNLRLTLGAINVYYEAGMMGAPVLGAIGGAHVRCQPMATAAVVGLALVGEPLVVFAWFARAGMSASETGLVVQYPALWIGEMVLGVVLFLGMMARRWPIA
jgi:hypothetical protein